jgi:pimeloyl-ACP methyl ester carboxylesterase
MILCNSSVDRRVRLDDGRSLAFSEFGDSHGVPLFFFHGAGSTRLTRHPDDSIIQELGVRLITVNRPGIGLSDASPGRRLLDWPSDVSQLADALGVNRFTVLGWSAGGPFALACAYRLPSRVQAVGVMSGLAPLHWPGIATTVSTARGRLTGLLERATEQGGRRLARMAGMRRGDVDMRAHVSIPMEVRAINQQRLPDLIRAREGERVRELTMLARPWGFRLEDIEAVVHLWHGSRDRAAPLYMAE